MRVIDEAFIAVLPPRLRSARWIRELDGDKIKVDRQPRTTR